MTDFLERVARERRADVAAARAWRSLERVRSGAWVAPRSTVRFGDALRERRREGRLAVIAEVKRTSPALGPLAAIDDPGVLARAYVAAGAAAISVLVEPRHWGGSLDDLRAVRAAVGPEVPILAKDVVVDEYQIAEARVTGADAVLLIAEALDDAALQKLILAGNSVGMDVLIEAHEQEAFERAIRCGTSLLQYVGGVEGDGVAGPALFGVNARDLREPSRIDRRRIHELAPLVPEAHLLVAESGITSIKDAEALPPRANAVLVGTALVRSDDPAPLIRALAAVRPARSLA